jgi:hypothetical protein
MHVFSERHKKLLEPLNLAGVGLEIGPSYNPTLPKSAGFRVETLDHLDQAALLEQYSRLPDASAATKFIEPVDYVTSGRSMLEVIREHHKYDFIIASHVIEHTPDLLGFLQDSEALLKPDGVLALAIPDKRYCFDIFQPLSSTGQVLDAHDARRARPSPGAVFDFYASSARRDSQPSWSPLLEVEPRLEGEFSAAAENYNRALTSDAYNDVHVWRFVPSSFRLILRDLNALGALGLLEQKIVVDPAQAEFFVYLSMNAAGCALDRLDLHERILREQAEPICRAAAGSRQAD